MPSAKPKDKRSKRETKALLRVQRPTMRHIPVINSTQGTKIAKGTTRGFGRIL
jgi:hypothetical protein